MFLSVALIPALVKRRRETVKSVGKITKTMKTVASSKQPVAQELAFRLSPFFLTLHKAFESIRTPPLESADKKVVTLLLTTVKGLCGSTNNNMTRSLLKTDLSNQTIVIWGDKGCGALENSKYVAHPTTPSWRSHHCHTLSYSLLFL